MAKLIEPRSIPLTPPVTVAHFCRPHMCSMSVNGYASTKVQYREITAERRTMTTLQMVRREASCPCCSGLLDSKFDRRHFVRALAIGGATLALGPYLALAAEGNYEAMVLSCIDPRMQEPVHKYTVDQNLRQVQPIRHCRRGDRRRRARVHGVAQGILGQSRHVDSVASHQESHRNRPSRLRGR